MPKEPLKQLVLSLVFRRAPMKRGLKLWSYGLRPLRHSQVCRRVPMKRGWKHARIDLRLHLQLLVSADVPRCICSPWRLLLVTVARSLVTAI